MELVGESQELGHSFWDTGLGSFGMLLRMGRDGGKHWDNKLAIIGGLSAPPSRGADAGCVRYKEWVSPTTPHLSMGAACRLLGRCTGSSPATTWFSVAPCHHQELSSSATVTGCGPKGKTSIKKTLEHDKQSFRYGAGQTQQKPEVAVTEGAGDTQY